MSLFEFISGMISLIIALAIAQLLISIGRLAQHHQQVRSYWPHTLWCLIVFFIAFLHWWSLWDFRDLEWNTAMFFYSLMGPMLLFFSVTLLTPGVQGKEQVDLHVHFDNVRLMFLWVFLATLVFMILDGLLFGTEPLINKLRITQIALITCVGVGLTTPKTSVQITIAAIMLSILVIASTVRYLPGVIA